jgi:hypothetical protein
MRLIVRSSDASLRYPRGYGDVKLTSYREKHQYRLMDPREGSSGFMAKNDIVPSLVH